MITADLSRGDRVQCCVKGLPFSATIVDYDEVAGRWQIEDTDPRVGRALVTSQQIVKKLGSGVAA